MFESELVEYIQSIIIFFGYVFPGLGALMPGNICGLGGKIGIF
jgi:hypothetical protein